MTDEDRRLLQELAAQIQALADGSPAKSPGGVRQAAPEVASLALAVANLAASLETLRQFSIALASGRIDAEAPPKQHLLDPLKSLQASLKHLTWQTQQVAAGNLDQHVDFLGDFSTAFNQMVAALKDKRRAEHEALQASKLASIGQLSAGIAHEINTPAQYVSDNLRYIGGSLPQLFKHLKGKASLSERDVDDLAKELPDAVSEALQGIERIAAIVQSMKEFSHPGAVEMMNANINNALESTLTVCQNAWKMVATVERRYDPKLPLVHCFASEVNQVFLNLILNAAQAIEASGKKLPGKIVIETFGEDEWAVVRVSDSGTGVPLDLRERIFDPFFSTKPVGQGTGQGLAISREVIEAKHGGRIEVGGQPGEGAVFTVRLPLSACPLPRAKGV